MSAENVIQNDVLLAIGSHPNVRVFRNNTGVGWTGEVIKRTPGMLILKNPRPLHSGLCVGSSDLIGWRTVTVTPEMVGSQVALFLGVEVKTGRGKASSEQQTFISNVTNAGGIAGVVRTKEEARKLVRI